MTVFRDREELQRRLERPLLAPVLRELLARKDFAGARRLLAECEAREKALRAAPRECHGS